MPENVPETFLPQDVKRHRKTTFDMLAWALTRRVVIYKMCVDFRTVCGRTAEWRIVRHLHKVLRGSSSAPTLSAKVSTLTSFFSLHAHRDSV